MEIDYKPFGKLSLEGMEKGKVEPCTIIKSVAVEHLLHGLHVTTDVLYFNNKYPLKERPKWLKLALLGYMQHTYILVPFIVSVLEPNFPVIALLKL